jgi:SAM-dependent methyltransferase
MASLTIAMSAPQTAAPTAPGPASPQACAWCEQPLGADAERLPGRIRCSRCGAATTDPWPEGAELEAAYGDWYRPESGRRFAVLGDALLSRTRAALAGRLHEIAPAGPILDVGAGDGALLDALRARGRDVMGLEPDPRHPDVVDRSLDEVEGEWAAVVFWHSLEHLPNPGEAVREAARLLVPGGVVVVAVPNTASLQARVFGDEWLHLDIPRHLVHLPARALQARLRENGFDVERVSPLRGGQIAIGWLHGLVGALPWGLDLYQSLRAGGAQRAAIPAGRRLAAVAAGIALFPVALAASAAEVLLGRGGTVYVEARHA